MAKRKNKGVEIVGVEIVTRIRCPFCTMPVEILYTQFANGEPDGGRYIQHHSMKVSELAGAFAPPGWRPKWEISCPLAGATATPA